MREKTNNHRFANLFLRHVNLMQLVFLAKTIAVMLKAGLPLNEALDIAKNSTGGRLKKIIEQALLAVQAGRSFSSFLIQYPRDFSVLFINAIKIGESSGTLAENLDYVSKQLEKEHLLLDKIKGAMFYPIIVLGSSFLLGLLVVFLVLPKITPIFQELKIDLPLSTRMLIKISNLAQNYHFFLLFGIIIVICLFAFLVKQKFVKPITHWLFLETPIIKNISRPANLTTFCRTLGILLKSGSDIEEALSVTAETMPNYYYKKALREVKIKIAAGSKLSDNLIIFQKIFPQLTTSIIRSGEQAGQLDETLLYLADLYEAKVDSAAKNLSSTVEPILLLIIGGLVAFLASSIITPIYKINSGFKYR